MNKILNGKKAIITGANQGLGFEIARKFTMSGADIMICARNEKKLEAAKDQLLGIASNKQKIISQVADVSKEEDVELITSKALNKLDGCNILVNYAGVYGTKNSI